MGLDATPARTRPRRLPAGFLGMLGLMLLVERGISRHDLDFLNADNWQCKIDRDWASKKARDYDVLCFGDSLVKLSFVPPVFEGRSGLKAYNLAVCGAQPPMSYYLLKRAIDGGARPKALLVDFWPPLLRSGPRHNLQQWPHLLGYREIVELGLAARDGMLFGSNALGKTLPSARDRHKVRAWVVSSLAGQPSLWRLENPWIIRHWNRNGGAQVMRAIPQHAADPKPWRDGFYPNWRCDGVNRLYIEKFLRLAAEHDIPVYWLLTPILPALQGEVERSGYDAQHIAFIRSWQERFPNVSVIDGRHTDYDPAVFMDPNHLGREGAFVFSAELGDLFRHLARGPSSPRQIAVPTYRARPVDDDLEDVVMSRMVYYGGGVSRR